MDYEEMELINFPKDGGAHETAVVDARRPVQNFEMDTKMVAFDELSSEMWEDNLFTNCVLNWRFAPGMLYSLTAAVGYERVREEIKFVMGKRGIDVKGAYLRKRLINLRDGVTFRKQA